MAPKAALLLLKQPIDFANYLYEAGWGLFVGSLLAQFHPAFFGRARHRVLISHALTFVLHAAQQALNTPSQPHLASQR
jgi:hypothetical protein